MSDLYVGILFSMLGCMFMGFVFILVWQIKRLIKSIDCLEEKVHKHDKDIDKLNLVAGIDD